MNILMKSCEKQTLTRCNILNESEKYHLDTDKISSSWLKIRIQIYIYVLDLKTTIRS